MLSPLDLNLSDASDAAVVMDGGLLTTSLPVVHTAYAHRTFVF